MRSRHSSLHALSLLMLFLLPLLLVGGMWLSPLAFSPVPWPDDSAFYFVAKELFQWPPQWVMLPQAPFEPTYRIFNFNTMPLYPILIGIGRWIGIDGTLPIKIWPLLAWALSGSFLAVALHRKGLPFFFILIWTLAFCLDPELRWASMLLRPESLIGLFGVLLIWGLTFGFPKKWNPRSWWWDPVACLLALSAYAHFNAIHLVFPVLLTFLHSPKRLMQIAGKTLLYLSPWLLCIAFHFSIFCQQMETQFRRFAYFRMRIFDSISHMARGLFQGLGNPTPWPDELQYASGFLWILMLLSAGLVSAYSLRYCLALCKKTPRPALPILLPSSAWVVSAFYLWYSKPEAWFMYFVHLSLFTFIGIGGYWFWEKNHTREINHWAPIPLLSTLYLSLLALFFHATYHQYRDLEASPTWRWSTYQNLVSCVDQHLSKLEKELQPKVPLQVWIPSPPDISIELSLLHPTWDLTRHNDFAEKNSLALDHGFATDAVVVTSYTSRIEQAIDLPLEKAFWIDSFSLLKKSPYFVHLWNTPGWKTNRMLCQRGRWQAVLFMRESTKQMAGKKSTSFR